MHRFLSGNPWSDKVPAFLTASWDVAPDWSRPHTFTVIISGTANRGLLGESITPETQPSHYEAGPFAFDPKVHPLGDAWDKISQKEPPTP